MTLDVLLVNPGASAQVYQGLADDYSAIEPPSLAGLFATYLRGKGLTVAILDAAALGLSPTEAAEAILTTPMTLIVVVVYGFQPSASTQSMTAAGDTCRALKYLDPSCKVMMTGTHPAAL